MLARRIPVPRVQLALREKIMWTLRKLPRSERREQLLEYALIAGLLVVGAIALITTLGQGALALWEPAPGPA